MTAPGILPPATSLRKYSPTPCSFCGEKPAKIGAGVSALPASGRPVASATIRSPSAAKPRHHRENPSVLHRFIDQFLHHRLYLLPLGRGLLQQYEKHVLLVVDHEKAAAGAVPFDLAQRARRRRLRIARIGADAETEPETKAIAGEIEKVAPNP